MKLWRRAAGAIKDQNSIWLAGVARRTVNRHPELETAIIKATGHDDLTVDHRNAQRVFHWLRASPSSCLRPLVYALSRRAQRTRSWAVALKCLILLHGVFCCKIPAVRRIGRLPFDLSSFVDGHSRAADTWACSALVRAYFAFLDQRAVYLSTVSEAEGSIGEELVKLQKWQHLLDLVIQIRPMSAGMRNDLVREAMDCVIVEIFDVYSRICNGIARILVRIYGAMAFEASMALKVLKKATVQSEKLSAYFDLCREIGSVHAKELPRLERIPEEDIMDVERILKGLSDRSTSKRGGNVENAEEEPETRRRGGHGGDGERGGGLKTVIKDRWEVFDEDSMPVAGGEQRMMIEYRRPPGGPPAAPDLQQLVHYQDLPDLITL